MSSPVEPVIKFVLVALLVVAALVALLPRRRTAGRPVISDKLFVATCVVGAACGAAGLVVLFAWPRQVLAWHLWELAAMPLVLLYAQWIAVTRGRPADRMLDEKQDFDMTRAAGLTWGLSVPAMCAPFAVSERTFDGGLWFPYFLFVTLLIDSALTLYYFKRR